MFFFFTYDLFGEKEQLTFLLAALTAFTSGRLPSGMPELVRRELGARHQTGQPDAVPWVQGVWCF